MSLGPGTLRLPSDSPDFTGRTGRSTSRCAPLGMRPTVSPAVVTVLFWQSVCIQQDRNTSGAGAGEPAVPRPSCSRRCRCPRSGPMPPVVLSGGIDLLGRRLPESRQPLAVCRSQIAKFPAPMPEAFL